MERAFDAGQRSGDDQDVVRLVRLDRRADAEMTVAGDRRHGEEDDAVAAVGSGGQLDRLRQLRLRAAGPAFELRHEAGLTADDRAVEAPELDVVAGHRGRQVGDARPRAMAATTRCRPALTVRRAEKDALDGLVRVVQRAVRAVDQEGVERRVRDDRRDRQPDGRQRDDPQQEPCAQRQPAHCAPESRM